MSAVGITENAKGDNKKFEIWCNSREEVYIVQVPDGILSFPITDWKVSLSSVLFSYLVFKRSRLTYLRRDDSYNELQSQADCCITAALVQFVK